MMYIQRWQKKATTTQKPSPETNGSAYIGRGSKIPVKRFKSRVLGIAGAWGVGTPRARLPDKVFRPH